MSFFHSSLCICVAKISVSLSVSLHLVLSSQHVYGLKSVEKANNQLCDLQNYYKAELFIFSYIHTSTLFRVLGSYSLSHSSFPALVPRSLSFSD